MYITDFTFNGIKLSDMGYAVCTFDKSTSGDISNGSELEFTTVPAYDGSYHMLARSSYPECIKATFSICKNFCVANYDPIMTVAEISRLSSWLGSKRFNELRVNAPGYEDIFFEGSFSSITRVELGGDTVGLKLEFISNRPFALKDPITETFTLDPDSPPEEIRVYTDVLGIINPKVQIVNTSGEILNGLTIAVFINDGEEDEDTISITRLSSLAIDEHISMDYPIISSNEPDIVNRFNYDFIKLSKNNIENYESNFITANRACEVTLTYNPAVNISM